MLSSIPFCAIDCRTNFILTPFRSTPEKKNLEFFHCATYLHAELDFYLFSKIIQLLHLLYCGISEMLSLPAHAFLLKSTGLEFSSDPLLSNVNFIFLWIFSLLISFSFGFSSLTCFSSFLQGQWIHFNCMWDPLGICTGFMILSFSGGSIADQSHNADHDPLGQHAPFAEHSAIPSAAHTCPYIAYFGPIHPSASTPNGSVSDASSVNINWNGPSAQSQVPSSYAFPPVDLHYHSWENHSPPFSTGRGRSGGSDPPSIASNSQMSARTNPDLSHSGSFLHPYVGHRYFLSIR